MRTFAIGSVAALVLFVHLGARAAPGDFFITFMATPESLSPASPGHAFMCISMHTTQNIKEECWGFYPESASDLLNGKGKVEGEFAYDASRFSKVTRSVKYKITEAQRKAAIAAVQKHAGAKYDLVVANCGDMALAAAAAAGQKVPKRSDFVKPTTFVEKLKALDPGV